MRDGFVSTRNMSSVVPGVKQNSTHNVWSILLQYIHSFALIVGKYLLQLIFKSIFASVL